MHNRIEGAGDVRRTHAESRRCFAKPKAWDGRRDNVEGGRGRRGGTRERLDYFADFDEAAGPAMGEEERNGILAVGHFVHIVDGDGPVSFDLNGDFEVVELAVDCILSTS
jgi:hypothetical protein